MSPDEVRAIRGALSRAAFARLLGVTPLTVLRWELPEGDKESRRPRAKLVEAMKRLGQGAPGSGGDEDQVLPLLDRLMTDGWARAEDEIIALLGSATLGAPGRALCAVGIAQTQMLCRLDPRGAFTTLLPILAEAEEERLPPSVAARVFVMAAVLFGAPDSRVFNPGRAHASAERASQLLGPEEHDQRVLLAVGRLGAARFLGPHVARRAYEALLPSLERAVSPLARLCAAGMHMRIHGDVEAVAARDLAEQLGFGALATVAMAERSWRLLRQATPPDVVLGLTKMIEERVEQLAAPAAETLLLALASQCDALARLGRLDEADAVVARATGIAKRVGLPPHALAAPAARLHLYRDRAAELESFALWLEDPRSPSAAELYARSMAAAMKGEHAAAVDLADRACAASEGGTGADYLVHDARIQAFAARILAGDHDGARAALAPIEALLAERPSVWHAALLQRLEGALHLALGRAHEARHKLESSLATFGLVADVVQMALGRFSLALAADDQARLATATAELESLGVTPPALIRRAPPHRAVTGWGDVSLADRVAGAVERLTVRGLPPELVRQELAAILGQLFPDGAPADEGVVATITAAAQTIHAPPDVDEPELPHFIAAAPATRKLKREIAQLSRCAATILIGGESGSGKEVVARAVHDLSARAARAYIPFNCASVPRELFDGQLFGYKKGAFTGATSDSPGVIGAADGGTLFLDEIGELPLDTQPKLLRFLENGEIFRLGERKPLRVDVRVLAATHRDLGALVRERLFREDLFYRLNVVPLHVPPLRERKEDIVALARVFVARLTPEGADAPELGADAVTALTAHAWPGNVRELRNVIERAMAYAPVPRVLGADHLRIG